MDARGGPEDVNASALLTYLGGDKRRVSPRERLRQVKQQRDGKPDEPASTQPAPVTRGTPGTPALPQTRDARTRPKPRRAPKPAPGTFTTAAAAAASVTDEDPDLQLKAVKWLGENPVDPAQRELVVNGIRGRVNKLSNGDRRLAYVKALARYADASTVADLSAVLDYPERVEGITGQERCWATALAALVRLGEADAARAALDKRLGSFFFRNDAKNALKPFVEVDAPQAELARELIDRIDKR
jgi:hypothetical protein